jgi:hypothetical protein
MNGLHELKRIEMNLDAKARVGEFGRLARLVAQSQGCVANMKGMAGGRLPERLAKIIEKADPGMFSAPGGSPATWGSDLAYDSANSNAFDAAAAWMKPLPMKSRVVASTVAAVATVVTEGAAKPVVDLDLGDQSLDPVKVASLIVVSNDLLELGGLIAARLFNAELRNGIAAATDAHFVSTLIAGTTAISSLGDFYFDLQQALAAISGGATSKYFAVMEPDNLKRLATSGSRTGPSYPNLRVDGGEVGGVQVLASGALEEGQVLLFDATQIAADPGTVELRSSAHGLIDLVGGNAPTFSLFQKDCSALRAERLFAFKLLRNTAAASISGAAYASDSP